MTSSLINASLITASLTTASLINCLLNHCKLAFYICDACLETLFAGHEFSPLSAALAPLFSAPTLLFSVFFSATVTAFAAPDLQCCLQACNRGQMVYWLVGIEGSHLLYWTTFGAPSCCRCPRRRFVEGFAKFDMAIRSHCASRRLQD